MTEFIEDMVVFDKCLNERFNELDVHGDGEEINNVYDDVFEKLDEDHNGTLDREEFRSLMKKIMQAVA
ncbi:hypothetical protein L1049_003316 [Liquidambar formosana]|uniref:EF-hand domain-containing protein n=1 Tax=Liquidambar formosana TaxID=63359 RepID=A0AAP0R7F4_LIQFO